MRLLGSFLRWFLRGFLLLSLPCAYCPRDWDRAGRRAARWPLPLLSWPGDKMLRMPCPLACAGLDRFQGARDVFAMKPTHDVGKGLLQRLSGGGTAQRPISASPPAKFRHRYPRAVAAECRSSRPSSSSMVKPCTSDHARAIAAAWSSDSALSEICSWRLAPIAPANPANAAWAASCSDGRVMSSRSVRNINPYMPGWACA